MLTECFAMHCLKCGNEEPEIHGAIDFVSAAALPDGGLHPVPRVRGGRVHREGDEGQDSQRRARRGGPEFPGQGHDCSCSARPRVKPP